MANILEILVRLKDEASGKFKTLGASIKGIKMPLTEMKSGLDLVNQGLDTAQYIIAQTVGAAVEYNKKVREMGQVTGLSAEEISRIIQVGDDWGITIDQLKTSLGMMTKNGVVPSIDALAALADEYINTTDRAAFAEKAAKLLGRQWQTLVPILAKGGDALRDQAAAVQGNLIVTEKQIVASRRLEVATEDLSDAYEGFKIAAGNELIPILAADLEGMTRLIEYIQTDGISGIGAFLTENQKVNDALRDLGFNSIEAFQMVSTKMPGYVQGLKDYRGAVEGIGESVTGMPEAFDIAIQKMGELNIASDKIREVQDAIDLATGKVTQEQLDQRDAIGFLTTQLALGNIKMDTFRDLLGKVASGAMTAEQMVRALEKAIAALKDKTVTIKVKYKLIGGPNVASEPGGDAPVVYPPAPLDPGQTPGVTGIQAVPTSTSGSGTYINKIDINIYGGGDAEDTASAVMRRLNEETRASAMSGMGYAG